MTKALVLARLDQGYIVGALEALEKSEALSSEDTKGHVQNLISINTKDESYTPEATEILQKWHGSDAIDSTQAETVAQYLGVMKLYDAIDNNQVETLTSMTQDNAQWFDGSTHAYKKVTFLTTLLQSDIDADITQLLKLFALSKEEAEQIINEFFSGNDLLEESPNKCGDYKPNCSKRKTEILKSLLEVYGAIVTDLKDAGFFLTESMDALFLSDSVTVQDIERVQKLFRKDFLEKVTVEDRSEAKRIAINLQHKYVDRDTWSQDTREDATALLNAIEVMPFNMTVEENKVQDSGFEVSVTPVGVEPSQFKEHTATQQSETPKPTVESTAESEDEDEEKIQYFDKSLGLWFEAQETLESMSENNENDSITALFATTYNPQKSDYSDLVKSFCNGKFFLPEKAGSALAFMKAAMNKKCANKAIKQCKEEPIEQCKEEAIEKCKTKDVTEYFQNTACIYDKDSDGDYDIDKDDCAFTFVVNNGQLTRKVIVEENDLLPQQYSNKVLIPHSVVINELKLTDTNVLTNEICFLGLQDIIGETDMPGICDTLSQ